jgi:hypothetical protein
MMIKVDIAASLGLLQVLLHMFQRDLYPNPYEFAQYWQAGQFLWREAQENGQSLMEKDP